MTNKYDPSGNSGDAQKKNKPRARYISLTGPVSVEDQIASQDAHHEWVIAKAKAEEAGEEPPPPPEREQRWEGPAHHGEGLGSIGEAINDIRDGRA